MKPVVPELPPNAPRAHPAWLRACARGFLRLCGWRVTGTAPDLPKLMVIAAPHTSAWDGIYGLAAKVALGADISFMGKAELFAGPLGPLLRWLGGFPVNRSSSRGAVEQVVQRFASSEKLWLAMAPEGTRREVEHWKTGFWRIAVAADVPVLCIYFHYPERSMGLGEVFEMSGDVGCDMQRIRRYYRPWIGRHRGTVYDPDP